MKNAKLTNKEIAIVDAEYEKHKYDNICPHTTNPLQLKSLCQRCRKLDILNINVYQTLSKLGSYWTASSGGVIADGFKSRSEAEEWAIVYAYPIKDRRRNIG